MIDRIEMILDMINDYFASGMDHYESIMFSADELRFISKCLSQYQSVLISEINRNKNISHKGEYDE